MTRRDRGRVVTASQRKLPPTIRTLDYSGHAIARFRSYADQEALTLEGNLLPTHCARDIRRDLPEKARTYKSGAKTPPRLLSRRDNDTMSLRVRKVVVLTRIVNGEIRLPGRIIP